MHNANSNSYTNGFSETNRARLTNQSSSFSDLVHDLLKCFTEPPPLRGKTKHYGRLTLASDPLFYLTASL